MRPVSTILGVTIVSAVLSGPVGAQASGATNLHVLSQDISRAELSDVMIANLRGLGLPRRGGEGCLFCHVGSMDTPRGQWDYASDEKLMKRKAREMLAMVDDINRRLEGLESRVAADLEVTCYTCHKGRRAPLSLTDRLVAAYQSSGVDSLTTAYNTIRERYFGGDVFDFRAPVLYQIAAEIAEDGHHEDGIAISELNEAQFPGEADVRLGTLVLTVRAALAVGGVGAAIEEFDRLHEAEPGVVDFSVLDGIGWTLFRREEIPGAIRVFERNVTAFPEVYVPHESLADALVRSDMDPERGFEILERWVAAHPDDEQARRVLLNLRELSG